MLAPKPFVLTNATRFPPVRLRGQSRSPSRSPLRKSQFAARELDPLLSNLSPESTLKALQTTETITSDGSGQDALARSIAEASSSEREIGIRAAVAAQKVKEWHSEIQQWPWPTRRDRGWGAGFLPHKNASQPSTTDQIPYLGFLPTSKIDEYQERIEDVRDGLEALELEDIKDHVFSAHVPQRSVSDPHSLGRPQDGTATGYGRMRDFTALITAIVIQALPELANLSLLLDTWEIRLSVLRQIPDITQSFRSTRAGVQTAFSVVRSNETGPLVTMGEYTVTKNILGQKVANLGAKIDKLLDMLEGQEDSLPKSWIDALENVENDYAAWVVEAEHIVIRNDLLSKALGDKARSGPSNLEAENGLSHVTHQMSGGLAPKLVVPKGTIETDQTGTPVAELPSNDVLNRFASDRRPSQKADHLRTQPSLTSTTQSTHRRGVSEVSMADSTFSMMSDISSAEIVDARSTQLLTSPPVNLVDNPNRASRDELSLITQPNKESRREFRPLMLQRASTASIEVISRDSIKKVTLTRSRSHDLLGQIGQISTSSPLASTPSQALQQLTGMPLDRESPSEVLESDSDQMSPVEHTDNAVLSSATVSPSPSLRVPPLQIRSRDSEISNPEMPALPRRSSKRLSQSFSVDTQQSPHLPINDTSEETLPSTLSVDNSTTQLSEHSDGTLEAKIKDILNTIPTKIRLAKEVDDNEPHQIISQPSSRSSTPIPALTLSPVKPDRTRRQTTPGDVRLFHLTKSGQTRDTPPVKLFVRAVGEHGERVMVRVGGGWADLAEYLREYSLHHGHRGLAESDLEVANFPAQQTMPKDASPLAASSNKVNHVKNNSISNQVATKRRSLPSVPTGMSTNESSSLNVAKIRKAGRTRPWEGSSQNGDRDWTPPPVPPIPATYTTQLPTTVTTTSNGVTRTNTIESVNPGFLTPMRSVSSPIHMSSFSNGQINSSSTTTASMMDGNSMYTPLGAAGPRSSGQRATSYNTTSTSNRESWVAGMVGKARAVSSSSSTITHGPTITTTTTISSRPTPSSRRVSGIVNSSPASTPGTTSPATDSTASKTSPPPTRPRSRVSFGDVSGIRRVFLRKKSDKPNS